MESPSGADVLAEDAKDAVQGIENQLTDPQLRSVEAGSRWLRDLLLYSKVGLRCPCGTIIVIVVQTGKIEIEASL
jgi:hypothetical protein